MIEFEICDMYGERKYIRVVEVFIHHYTQEMMRRLRVDCLFPNTVDAKTMEMIVNEEEYKALLERRVHD